MAEGHRRSRPQQWLKGTPRSQQWLLIGISGCRLPGLKRSKPSKSSTSLPTSAGKRYPNNPNTRNSRTRKSHHKATAMAEGHPPAAAMASYRRSRLPFARPQTLKHSKSPPSSAGTRYTNKPNTRHSRTQKPPQGHSNGWRAPPGRSNGFL